MAARFLFQKLKLCSRIYSRSTRLLPASFSSPAAAPSAPARRYLNTLPSSSCLAAKTRSIPTIGVLSIISNRTKKPAAFVDPTRGVTSKRTFSSSSSSSSSSSPSTQQEQDEMSWRTPALKTGGRAEWPAEKAAREAEWGVEKETYDTEWEAEMAARVAAWKAEKADWEAHWEPFET